MNNLDNIESGSLDLTEIVNKDLKVAEDVNFAGSKDILSNPNGDPSMSDFFDTEYQINLFDPNLKEGYENIIKFHFSGKNIDQIAMEDIYNLSDTEKASLARDMAIIQPIDNKKMGFRLNGKIYKYEDITKKLEAGGEIGGTGSNDIPKDVFREYNKYITIYKERKQLEIYSSFFKSGEEIPNMPFTYILGTGDLSTTSGPRGLSNKGREYIKYDIDNPQTQTNSLSFGIDKGSPMEISVSAGGIDPKVLNGSIDGGGYMVFKFVSGNDSFIVRGTYSADVNSLDPYFKLDKGNGCPDDIIISNNKITIPSLYQQYSMSVMTASNAFKDRRIGYDEVNFNFSIKNGNLGSENKNNTVASYKNMSDNYETEKALGIYELNPNETLRVSGFVNQLPIYGRRTMKENIPLDITIGADNTRFGNPLEFITSDGVDPNNFDLKQSKYYNGLFNTRKNELLKGGYNKDIINNVFDKMQDSLENLMKNIDISGFKQVVSGRSDKVDQINAEKLLIQNRYLAVLYEISKNTGLLYNIANNKYTLIPDYEHGKRKVELNTNLTYIKE